MENLQLRERLGGGNYGQASTARLRCPDVATGRPGPAVHCIWHSVINSDGLQAPPAVSPDLGWGCMSVTAASCECNFSRASRRSV